MKICFVGNGKMVNAICENPCVMCVGIYANEVNVLLAEPECVVDFSHPNLLEKSIELATKFKVPLIIGTTGYNNEKMAYLKEKSKIIPIMYSENYSSGISLIKQFLKKYNFAKYNKKICEIHHQTKLDSPSGTALSLAKELDNCEIISHRLANVTGLHEIVFEDINEKITIKHEAKSRNLFVEGVIMAINYMQNKTNGFYCFEDVFDAKCKVNHIS